MNFCDSHCHLDFDAFNADRVEVIERAKTVGVDTIINCGLNQESSWQVVALAQTYPGTLYASVGFHPNDGSDYTPESIAELRELAKQPGVVAIGEIGLDYYRDHTPAPFQREMFEAQLALAAELDMPVIIHNREASVDLVPMLKDWARGLDPALQIKSKPGVLHSYLEGIALAEEMAEYGFVFGIGGPVTYANGQARREVVSALPLEKILLETDAPFLTPQAHRGQRNEPAYIPLIANQVAECLGMTLEQVATITTQNVKSLFRF